MKYLPLFLLLCGTAWADGPWEVLASTGEIPLTPAIYRDGEFYDICKRDQIEACQDFVDAMNAAHERRTKKQWGPCSEDPGSDCAENILDETCLHKQNDYNAHHLDHPKFDCSDDPGSGLTPQ